MILTGGSWNTRRNNFSSATLSPMNWPWIEPGPLQWEAGSYPPQASFCPKQQTFHFGASNMTVVIVSRTGCSDVGLNTVVVKKTGSKKKMWKIRHHHRHHHELLCSIFQLMSATASPLFRFDKAALAVSIQTFVLNVISNHFWYFYCYFHDR